ncbi:MAG TPA: chromosome partitioning protein ParB [Porphyromonadaceae bacterium]|nr:chromosome partitioning protein ParB [Porphyromonadaceae bacterium]
MEANVANNTNAIRKENVSLALIQPSKLNPRKTFDEAAIKELSDSIASQGVLQQIGLRPIADTDRYEIIFGERRYRASIMAGLETIPADIYDVTDEEAVEIAVTENLQREGVSPIEEANAYQSLMDSGRYDVQSLAVQFGKSEAYIRTRLKFTTLIPEIAQLLEVDAITMSVASEICRYGTDIQKEVYDKHLCENTYGSWRGLKASEVARRIEQNFTTDLERYSFDKGMCASCPHNTKNLLLFCEGTCGKCTNRKCLEDMNSSYLIDKAVDMIAENPAYALRQGRYDTNDAVVERLSAMGYEIETPNTYIQPYPTMPHEPTAEEYETTEDFAEAHSEYEQDLSEYNDAVEQINAKAENGEIIIYIVIEKNDIRIGYAMKPSEASVNGTADNKADDPIVKLEKQDIRNKEIAVEKTVADTKKQILEADMTETKFGQDEEKMVYYFMLSSLRKEHFSAVGLTEKQGGYLSDEEKMEIVSNLNAKTKAVIRRDYLIANFKDAFGSNMVAKLLLGFAKKHMPEQLAEIEKGYNEVYEKRHQRIEEKKAALMPKNEEPQTEETETTSDEASENAA